MHEHHPFGAVRLHFDCDSVVNDTISRIVLYPFQIHRIGLIIVFTEAAFDSIFEFSHHLLAVVFFYAVVLYLPNDGFDIFLES